MSENGLTQRDIATLSGLTQSSISRILSGKQQFVTNADLSALASATGRTNHQRAEVIAARMLDDCVGPNSDLIQIQIKEPSKPVKVFRSQLPPRITKVFDYLASIVPVNPAAEAAIESFARALGFDPKREPK